MSNPTTSYISGESNKVRQRSRLHSRICLHLILIFLLLLPCASLVLAQDVRIYFPKEFQSGRSAERHVINTIYGVYKVDIDLCEKTDRYFFTAPQQATLFRANSGDLVTLSGLDRNEQKEFRGPPYHLYWRQSRIATSKSNTPATPYIVPAHRRITPQGEPSSRPPRSTS